MLFLKINNESIVKVMISFEKYAITLLMCRKHASCMCRKFYTRIIILPAHVGNMLPARVGKNIWQENFLYSFSYICKNICGTLGKFFSEVMA